MNYDWKDVVYADLIGKTFVKIEGLKDGSGQVDFELSDGTKLEMAHQQDCCEGVAIYDLDGKAEDLIGSPLTMAEEVSDADRPPNYKPDYEPESSTWTFYKFATAKGYVTIRWLGESNGYYSESVDFKEVPK